MQKKLIALAVAGLASTGAFAQANVTVYGIADASFDVVGFSNANAHDFGAAAAPNVVPGRGRGNTNRVSTNSSYIGFKGAEALGNGLTAVFQFESGIGFDNAGSLGATRDSYVGVASPFGTVVLGNLTGPTRALGAAVDVNSGATGIGANSALLGKLGNNLLNTTDSLGNYPSTVAANPGNTTCARSTPCTSIFDTRWKNAIAYVSPSFAGLNLTAAYVANENKNVNGAAAANTNGYDVGLKYANGPIMAGVTYNAVAVNNGASATQAADLNISDFRVGASYDFGVASVRAIYDLARANHFGANNKVTQAVWGLGGTFNVTPASKLVGQVYVARDLKANGSSQDDTGAKLFTVGVEHSLSKRTMLKAVYSRINNDDNAAYDFGIGAVGLGTAGIGNAGTAAAPLSTFGSNVQGVSIGLRHSF